MWPALNCGSTLLLQDHAGQRVGQHRLQAVADLDADLVLVGRDQQDRAVVDALAAQLPGRGRAGSRSPRSRGPAGRARWPPPAGGRSAAPGRRVRSVSFCVVAGDSMCASSTTRPVSAGNFGAAARRDAWRWRRSPASRASSPPPRRRTGAGVSRLTSSPARRAAGGGLPGAAPAGAGGGVVSKLTVGADLGRRAWPRTAPSAWSSSTWSWPRTPAGRSAASC